jgi:TetR/AcrR family transcriptional repressor of lmrAB and yxaGH operons
MSETVTSRQKDKIIRATAQLLRRRGFAATGLSDIIENSHTPKGSIYHYFPGGKDEIAAAAVRYAGDKVRRTLDELAATTTTPAALLRAYGALLAGWMADSGFRDGCPITTAMLETAPDKIDVAAVGKAAFASWSAVIEAQLIASGVKQQRAQALSRLAIMTLEGALVLARVEASPAPIRLATDEIAALFERECCDEAV